MKKWFAVLSVAAFSLCCAQTQRTSPAPPPKPKLVVAIIVDQFRFDYLQRFRANYNGGLARMLERGAVFSNAYHEHFPTVTAIGHATFLSGTTPSISGIVGNEWYDRASGKQVTSVSDDNATLLGGTPGRRASSPHRLLVSTIGDELKMANRRTKVVSVSLKDRGSILPAGRMADGAYWFDSSSGNFVSSSWYFKEMPKWASDYNQQRPGDAYVGKQWMPFDAKPGETVKPYFTLGKEADMVYYESLARTPYGNDIVEAFAERAIEGEQLGRHEDTDILAVSFSSNDYIGHALGPDHPAVRDISIQTDRLLGKFFQFIDSKVGMDNVLVVFSADHGVVPFPEVQAERKMPGGRMSERTVLTKLQTALTERYGEGQWVVGKSGPAPYLNYTLIAQKKLNAAEVRETAASAVRELQHIYRVYTRDQIGDGRLLDDLIDRRVRNGFHTERAADLFIVAEPFWLFEDRGTSHGTPYNYDAHVPVVFMGPGIQPGRYPGHVATYDIAPTLAHLLEVEPPNGAVGRVLTEMLAK